MTELPHRPDERLWSIAGRWATTGHVIGDPPVSVTGYDTYDVFVGGHFLVHHVDVMVGDQHVEAIEIIGEPDPNGSGWLARSYDSAGACEVMALTIDDDGVFRFTGGPDIAPAAHTSDEPVARVRASLTPADDGTSMRATWERSPDGVTWTPWMDISFSRIQSER